MKIKILKVVYWALGIIFAVLVFLWFLGTYGYQIQNYFIDRQQEKYLAERQKLADQIIEAQKNDNYGGKTPEETLNLYITALKAGDIELASKYWEISLEYPDLKAIQLNGLNEVIKRDGDLNLVIKNNLNIKNLGVKTVWNEEEVSFVYEFITEEEIRDISIVSRQEITTVIPIGTQLEVGKSLRLNPYTKVWKIIQ